MAKNWWFKFDWNAWRNDHQLRRCSKETRGFWIDCIAAMEDQETYFLEGTPEEICRDIVSTLEEFERSLAELDRYGAANVKKIQGTVRIESRRLMKKRNLTEYNRIKKQESRSQLKVKAASTDRVKSIDIRVKSKTEETTKVVSSEEEICNNNSIDKYTDVQPEKKSTRERSEPKTRLPADYKPPDEFLIWAREECPDLKLEYELEEFITFWRDIATKNNRRTVRGWNATWKDRMKKRQEQHGANQNGTNNYRTARSREAIESYNRAERLRAELDGPPK